MPTRSDSKTLRMPLNKPVDEELAREIEKQSVYVSEDLRKLAISADLSEVEITYEDGSDVEQLCSKVSRFTATMIRGHRKIEPTIHHTRQRASRKPYVEDVFGKLLERGWLYEHGPGVVSLSGPALGLFNLIDDTLNRAYAAVFGPVPRQFPAMVNASLLARCGYFEMHPNALSFVSRLVNDFDEIEGFRQANKGRDDGVYLTHAKAFSPPRHCLNPAACFPCYEALQGQTVPKSGTAMTWMGRVFRYESANIVGLDRLWEFNVRELVFLGGDEYLQNARKQSVDIVINLLEQWDLDGQIETATDPFFATVHAARSFWQRSMDVKYEIKLPLAPLAGGRQRSLAVGSINLHGPFFGDRFKINHNGGEEAHTGCVGFGLERWVLALFTQHGFDQDQWPAALQSAFGNRLTAGA